MQSVAKASLRIGRNALGGYSDNMNRARDATTSDPHPPSHAQLVELSESTFNDNDRGEIITILDKRLGARGKLWPQTFKSLIVLCFCLLNGSTRFVRHYQQNIHLVKTLREFQHIDDLGTDQGANIRERARYITALLQDEERLNYERKHGEGSWDPSRHAAPKPASPVRTRVDPSPKKVDQRRQEQDSDRELEEALRLSKEEEERRQRELKAQKDGGLFDDVASKDGKDLLDFSAPSQSAGFDPYAQQQAQQMEWMRQQQLMQMQAQADAQQAQWMAQQAYMQQQAAEQQAMAQQQAAYYRWQAQQQQAYAQQQAQLAQQQVYQPPVQAQPTGNPFSAFAPSPQPPPAATAPAPQQNSLAAHQAQQQSQQRTGRHAELEAALSTGQGVDTFGNYGNLRFGKTGQ